MTRSVQGWERATPVALMQSGVAVKKMRHWSAALPAMSMSEP
jgi:hypothetical protein